MRCRDSQFQPWTFSHLAAGLRTIALKPYDQILVNVTASELPARSYARCRRTSTCSPVRLSHEFHHNTLFFGIEERGRFLSRATRTRSKARTILAVGRDVAAAAWHPARVYVFLPVFRFWRLLRATGR